MPFNFIYKLFYYDSKVRWTNSHEYNSIEYEK